MAFPAPEKKRPSFQVTGEKPIDLFWVSESTDRVLDRLDSAHRGLLPREAQHRLHSVGPNEFRKQKRRLIFVFLSKFANPLMMVLLAVAGVSFLIGQQMSGIIVLLMALVSVVLTFVQEYRADKEAEKLSEMVHTTATVYRNGKTAEIKIREIVPGDILYLSAGDIVPADVRILTAKDLFVNQASFTGEAYPVEKMPEPILTPSSNPFEWHNIAFMGSAVVSGTATAAVFATGEKTEFGALASKLAQTPPVTRFEIGLKDFSWLMIRLMIVLVIIIFGINALFKGNLFESLLFSLAVAIGLTPEMLPVVLTVNLSRGAWEMSKKKVIVKHLNSIQNFGGMDVLCTDKTGTLTLGEVVLERHFDVDGNDSDSVFHLAYINSYYQTGLKNLLDKAVLKHRKVSLHDYRKVDEIPYDFSRKMMSVVIEKDGQHELICKGAPEEVFRRCSRFEVKGELVNVDGRMPPRVTETPDILRKEGFRVLAVARRQFGQPKNIYTRDDENDLVLMGFVIFLDPPKPSARDALVALENEGIELKVLTGDNELVTAKICKDLGFTVKGTLLGEAVDEMSREQLKTAVETNTIFARLTPAQKEHIIRQLKENGHTVGYLGDGINDAPSLKISDIGISVDNATDIAKEMADIILLEKSLMVLADGVREGRKTFANVLKYVNMGASSNFGNMVSVTGASLFLPFLPMAPIQILLNNFLYDFSQLSIPTDNVDEDWLKKPIPWNVSHIQKFMLVLGPTSSIFDFVTYGVLLVAGAPIALFHTVWFLESLLTQTLVIHIIRTSKIPFLESRPSLWLILTSVLIVGIGVALVFTPVGTAFGFVAPPAIYLLAVAGIVTAYLITVYFVKNLFIKHFGSLFGSTNN